MNRTVVVTGPPASGKTIIRRSVESFFPLQGEPFLNIGIDEVLREMVRTGKAGGEAWIDDNDAVLLKPGTAMLRSAFDEILDRVSAHSGSALIEVPVNARWFRAFTELDRSARALVIFLTAPLRVRRQRNVGRGRDRISDAGLVQMPATLPPAEMQAIMDNVETLLVTSTVRPLVETIRLCQGCCRLHLGDHGDAAGTVVADRATPTGK
ncbi:hypothetical protein [Actinomadura sp. NPDC049753]|uniref:phosphotransferase-like protein n=1 Tax=Actinomadura sp. NPDC049753 TaxID=3154739 RepID=UPI0034185CC5